MALTGLQAYIEPPDILSELRGTMLPQDEIYEYCRNEYKRNIIRMSVIPANNDATVAGEVITIRLMKARRDRLEEVVQARKEFTFIGAVPATGQSFEFDLRSIYHSNAKMFPIVRHGMYFFKVERTTALSSPVTAITRDFRVTVMTTDQLESQWLRGATRKSNEDRLVRFQPRELTGVKIIEVSKNHPLEEYQLALVYDRDDGTMTTTGPKSKRNAYLSWDGGALKKINLSIPDGLYNNQYTLVNRERKDYIVVQVDIRLIPNANTTEDLMVERALIQRQQLRDYIDAEVDWLERTWLHMPLDPALIVSDFTLANLSPAAGSQQNVPALPENSDYDIKAPPISHTNITPGHYLSLQVPYWRPLHFDYLEGCFETARVVTINPKNISNANSGFIEINPINSMFSFSFLGFSYYQTTRGPMSLPSFWRYRYYAGFAEDTLPKDLLEFIGMRAAIRALVVLGQMYRGGITSESVSRDGVSTSVGFNVSGVYGMTIREYQNSVASMEKQLKGKYFGMYMSVV